MPNNSSKTIEILNDFISFITPEFNKNLEPIRIKTTNKIDTLKK